MVSELESIEDDDESKDYSNEPSTIQVDKVDDSYESEEQSHYALHR